MFYYNYYKSLLKFFIKDRIKGGQELVKEDASYLDIGIINPSIGTSNLGDLIIEEAVVRELRGHYPNALFTNYPSQLHTSNDAKRMMGAKDCLFVSGTNLLSSNMDRRYQWKLDPSHKKYLKNNVILCGVGWWQYQNTPNKYTVDLYKKIFNTDSLHSVRDSYTKEMLGRIGIKNVVNTTCPTLWRISPELCAKIPVIKSLNVVTTLTFYKADPTLDKRMLEILLEHYKHVYLWVQGLTDITYLKEIFPRYNEIHLISPTIDAYNKILEDPSVEYVGTRLHAGVRAIQKGIRTLIIAVDNRAIEIGKDTNLNVIKREDIEEMLDFIDNSYTTNIKLPLDAINKWRERLPKTKF